MQSVCSVEFEMTDQLADQVVRATLSDWKHFMAMFAWCGATPAFLALVLLAVVLCGARPQLAPSDYMVMIGLLALATGLIIRFLVYRQARWGLLLLYQGGGKRTVRVTFSESGVAIDTAGLVGSRDWHDVAAIEVFRDLWLFRFQPSGSLGVPRSVLTDEGETLVRRKAAEMQVPVRE
jgi:hypothetical protein